MFLAGGLTLTFIGPVVKLLMSGIGLIIMKATELQPFFMGIIVSVALLHFVLPVCLSLFFDWILRKKGKIKTGDYYFE